MANLHWFKWLVCKVDSQNTVILCICGGKACYSRYITLKKDWNNKILYETIYSVQSTPLVDLQDIFLPPLYIK